MPKPKMTIRCDGCGRRTTITTASLPENWVSFYGHDGRTQFHSAICRDNWLMRQGRTEDLERVKQQEVTLKS